MLTGDLPIDWTRANIAPVFKKGSKLQAINYRPVSLTCITCKLFEHIICRHVLDHLEQHKILTDLQHGFRSGRSCETQLITTFQDIAEMYDKKGSQIDIAVLDFSIVSSKVRLSADDCLIYRQIKRNNDQIELQRDLNLLESWGVKWGMRFNAAKCNIMRVSRIRLPFLYSYKLSGQVLDEDKDSKYLGVPLPSATT